MNARGGLRSRWRLARRRPVAFGPRTARRVPNAVLADLAEVVSAATPGLWVATQSRVDDGPWVHEVAGPDLVDPCGGRWETVIATGLACWADAQLVALSHQLLPQLIAEVLEHRRRETGGPS